MVVAGWIPMKSAQLDNNTVRFLPWQRSSSSSTVCFQIIRNLETMHDGDLPTFLIISVPIIFKHNVHVGRMLRIVSLRKLLEHALECLYDACGVNRPFSTMHD